VNKNNPGWNLRKYQRLLLLGTMASLAACASPIPQGAQAVVDMPAGWSMADAAGAGGFSVNSVLLSAWWERFDDPELAELVGRALQANTSVLGAQAALEQSQALRDVASASLGPTVDSSASAQRGRLAGQGTGNQLQAGLDAQWVLDVFGARRAAVRASNASVDASEASLGDVQVQIAAEVALNYIVLRAVQLRTLIASENLASLEETLQITRWRQQAGLVSALEAEQALAAVEQNRAQLPGLQASAVQTQHALAVLSGQAPAGAVRWVPPAFPVVPQARDGLSIGIPAETLRQRADVRAAEFEVAAALARVGQAQAQRWPSFAIGGSVGLSAATVGALSHGSSVVGSVLASVTLPVFDGGALRAQVRVQQAALAQARQQYRASVLAALAQVEDALAAIGGNRQRLASLRRAAESASEAALLARQRYSSGLIDFQTVLETQRTLFATQDGVAIASADVSSDHVRLFRALGGGWTSSSGTQNP
jgi:multidrug efflux system outer membrane protein